MKQCTKCKETKSIQEFRKHKNTKDNLTTYCKSCLDNQVKDWSLVNRDKLNKNQQKWRQVNKGKKNADTAMRHAVKMQRTPAWLTKEQRLEIKDFYVMAKELEAVFGWKQCVDHIIPLQGKTVSGLHVPSNLQILSAKDNMEKGNRFNG